VIGWAAQKLRNGGVTGGSGYGKSHGEGFTKVRYGKGLREWDMERG
jgi:hypothetical protein